MQYFSFLCTYDETKFVWAVENLSMLHCMLASEPALRVQLSVNRKSLMMSVITLVSAWSLLRLNSFLSILKLKPIPTSPSLKASVSTAENMMLNSVGPGTQPCFMLFVTGNGSDVSPFSWTQACMRSWNCHTMEMNLSGHLFLAMIFHRFSLLTVSKALVRLTKVENRSEFWSWHFSCSCLAAKTMSMVPLHFLKPHWLSGMELPQTRSHSGLQCRCCMERVPFQLELFSSKAYLHCLCPRAHSIHQVWEEQSLSSLNFDCCSRVPSSCDKLVRERGIRHCLGHFSSPFLRLRRWAVQFWKGLLSRSGGCWNPQLLQFCEERPYGMSHLHAGLWLQLPVYPHIPLCHLPIATGLEDSSLHMLM